MKMASTKGICSHAVYLLMTLLVFLYTVFSAWDLLANQEIMIEDLALALPDHFGFFMKIPAVTKGLEIESML